MTNQGKPFSTEEEQLEGGAALASAPDTTTGKVENAIPLGREINDSNLSHVRWLKASNGDLMYQVFRGPSVPDRFWGTGEFGVCLLDAAETVWRMDDPEVSFAHEVVRHEAVGDDPKEDPKYPPHYYGGYMVTVVNVDRKPGLSDERIIRLAAVLDALLEVKLAEWGNGS
jgi:hypothetical protein